MTILELYLALHKIVHSEKTNMNLLSSEIGITIPTELSRWESGNVWWTGSEDFEINFHIPKDGILFSLRFTPGNNLLNYFMNLQEQREQLERELEIERDNRIPEKNITEEKINLQGKKIEI
jgi:hypothetical protein